MLRDSAMIAMNNTLNFILRENSSYSEMFWKWLRIPAPIKVPFNWFVVMLGKGLSIDPTSCFEDFRES